jgi:hypothetical protein
VDATVSSPSKLKKGALPLMDGLYFPLTVGGATVQPLQNKIAAFLHNHYAINQRYQIEDGTKTPLLLGMTLPTWRFLGSHNK